MRRTLEALRAQTLVMDRWELLLIDNASSEKLAEKWNLSWHPSGRIIREEEVGLTAARLRALKELKSELLVFVDDDNVLDPEYLEKGLEVSAEWPLLGAWGCQYFAEYDGGMPADWKFDVWSSKLETDLWTNLPDRNAAPFGGGMYLRRAVADAYLQKSATEPMRKLLGRSGTSLSSYEDFDIAFTACDIGYGIGRFKCLKLIHLIPLHRTTKEYVWKITRDSAYSDVIFRYLRGEKPPRRLIQINLTFLYSIFRESCKGRSIRLKIADQIGRRKAIKLLNSIK